MELLIWHTGLGSDDEQATEEELCARILYAYTLNIADESRSHSGINRKIQLELLHLLQGLVTFTRLLQRSTSPEATSGRVIGKCISTTLSKRRFIIKQVESNIYMALGIVSSLDHTVLQTVHESLLSNLYDTFTLFHGTIVEQLMIVPREKCSTYQDGMAHLHQIQDVRKQIRKLRILMEKHSFQQESDGEVDMSFENRMKTLEQQLHDLLGDDNKSTSAHMVWENCELFFPKLLCTLDVKMISAFHGDLSGVGYFPMEQDTFLMLQSFVNGFQLEFQNEVKDLAVFYKGNVLWNSMSPRRLHLIQQFLRCREQDGMDFDFMDPLESNQYYQREKDDHVNLWMSEKCEETFLPVWASKTTYAECAVVRHISPQPRKLVQSLHKQNSLSLSSIVADLATTHIDTSGKVAIAEHILAVRSQRFRSNTACFRNQGFLANSGHYLPSYEHTSASLWAPLLHPEPVQDMNGINELVRLVVWHERDITLLLTIPQDIIPSGLLARFEWNFDSLKLHEVANVIWARYQQMNTISGNSREKSNTALPPFIYLNRVNLAFKVEQIPRLIKSRDDDVFPRPLMLLAHYLPPLYLLLLTKLHTALHRDHNKELWVKTLSDGWLTAKRSQTTERELYAFYDTKIASIGDLYAAHQELVQNQFGDVFI